MSLPSAIASRLLRLPRPLTRDVLVERDLRVPMDDGVVLLADRYVPRDGGPAARPTVLVRTPYGRAQVFGLVFGRLLAERGLQVLVQSVRGTFGSGGEFNPFDERDDGLATLRWIEAQPWHAGKVGMTGPSYVGLTQWAVARDERLGALTPSVTASQFHGMSLGSGAISLDTAASWIVVVALQEGRLGPLRMIRGLQRLSPVFDHLPLGELDVRATGREVPFFAEWLENAATDAPYWAARDFSAGVGDVRAPVQLVGGWHDIFLPWMLEDFAALRAAGRSAQLVVGPWAHTSPGLLGVSTKENLAWLRAHLLGDDRMVDDAPVRVYVTGERRWRSLPEWPPPGTEPWRLHLQPGGALASAAPPEDGGATAFRYDPADPTPAVGGPTLFARTPVVDNRELEARADVRTWTSPPLAADLEVLGTVTADVHVDSELPHFDVFVRLNDVAPDGTSHNVTDALVRVEDGASRVVLDLWPCAHRFAAGHRLRVLVAGGAHPRYARNTGTGEPVSTTTRLVAGERAIRHDAARPSALVLPIAGGQSATSAW